jgi:hypothetical protein
MIGEHHINTIALHPQQLCRCIDGIDAYVQIVPPGIIDQTTAEHPPAAEDTRRTDTMGETRGPSGNIPQRLQKNPQGKRWSVVRKNRKKSMIER